MSAQKTKACLNPFAEWIDSDKFKDMHTVTATKANLIDDVTNTMLLLPACNQAKKRFQTV